MRHGRAVGPPSPKGMDYEVLEGGVGFKGGMQPMVPLYSLLLPKLL